MPCSHKHIDPTSDIQANDRKVTPVRQCVKYVVPRSFPYRQLKYKSEFGDKSLIIVDWAPNIQNLNATSQSKPSKGISVKKFSLYRCCVRLCTGCMLCHFSFSCSPTLLKKLGNSPHDVFFRSFLDERILRSIPGHSNSRVFHIDPFILAFFIFCSVLPAPVREVCKRIILMYY